MPELLPASNREADMKELTVEGDEEIMHGVSV